MIENVDFALLRTEPRTLSLAAFELARKEWRAGLVLTAATQSHQHPSHFRLSPYMHPTRQRKTGRCVHGAYCYCSYLEVGFNSPSPILSHIHQTVLVHIPLTDLQTKRTFTCTLL